MAEEQDKPEKDNGMNAQEQREFIRRVIQEIAAAGGNPEVKTREERKQERLDRIAQRKADREERKNSERKKVEDLSTLKLNLSPIHEQAQKDREAQNKNIAPDDGGNTQERDRNEQERKPSKMEFRSIEPSAPPADGFRPKEFLLAAVIGGAGIKHMWKTTFIEGTDYNVLGGVFTVQGTTVEVPDSVIVAGGDTGFIVLAITRDADSRAYSSYVVEWHATAPTSDYATEYYILAEIVASVPRQHRFEEIISQEVMIVALGELVLNPLSSLTRNTYAPPS